MPIIYECPCCGAHHFAEHWRGHSICYCPSCHQPSHREVLDYLSDLLNSRFWPYNLSEQNVNELNPEWGKW